MDIQHIRYFLAVAHCESFSRAARQLFVTQPILTRCIRNLEEELGLPLIVRTTRSFALTEAGQLLADHGSRLVAQHEDIFRRLDDLKELRTGELRISSPGTLLDIYFPHLVTRYHQLYPGIGINIRESESRPATQNVLDGSADIGLVMLPLENADRLHIFPIVQDAVHVIVRADHPFAGMDAVDMECLKDTELITYDDSTTLYHMLLSLCSKQGFSPTIAYQSVMPNFILNTIALGSCVGVLPRPMLGLYHQDDLVSVPLRPHFPWEIAMITAKDRYLSHAAAGFLSFAQDFFAQQLVLQAET